MNTKELEEKIKYYFSTVTDEQFEKDLKEVERMPSSKYDVKLFGRLENEIYSNRKWDLDYKMSLL